MDPEAPLCLTGHLDVVPLGARAWTKDRFAGETAGDLLAAREGVAQDGASALAATPTANGRGRRDSIITSPSPWRPRPS